MSQPLCCPRSGHALKGVEIDEVRVDLCEDCGGVWFDNFELKKFDEKHEAGGESLIELMAQHARADLELSERLKSPRHPEIVMMRRFFSPRKQIEIDECPQSGGIWLDAGELARIRDLFPTEEERKKFVSEFIGEVMSSPEMKAMNAQSEERVRKAKQVAGMLRWICPSYWIEGDQDWGAF